MSSRRNKDRQTGGPFGEPAARPALSPVDAADAIYGDAQVTETGVVIRTVRLKELTIDPAIQCRVDGLNEQRIEQYLEFLLAGGEFKDPIVVFRDLKGRLLVAAGFHRCETYRRALEQVEQARKRGEALELKPLRAEIRDGSHAAAIEWAEEDNLTHGLELSARDKRNILVRRFERRHEWIRLSNRALAAKLGVHHDTVAAWRSEIEDAPGGNPPGARVGADGKAYDVSNIQAANQLRAAREALAKLDLPPIKTGTSEYEAASELIRWLSTSLRDFKLLAGKDGRLRRYLPYALGEELGAKEPRVSWVNWMRGELPKWKEEQERARFEEQARQQAARDFATIDELRTRILAALADGKPKRSIELAAALGDPAPLPYRQARTQLKEEGLLIEDVSPGGRVSFRLAARAEVAPSDNGYQMDEPEQESEPAADWLDTPAHKGQATSDDGFRQAFAEFLNLGERVALYIEIELDSGEPLPSWLREDLDTLAELLHGYSPEGDIWNPGLVELLGECAKRAAEWETRDQGGEE